jgi:hypothetical protein
LSLYIVQFVRSNNVLSKIDYFERTLIRKNDKNKKIQKNGIRKKKMNFERTLFDQTTSSLSGYDIWKPSSKRDLLFYFASSNKSLKMRFAGS